MRTDEEKNARLVDEYRIDTIPRSYVLTPEGQVVDKRTGYIPAAEYAAWLGAARDKLPTPSGAEGAVQAPPPVGAREADANVAIWFVDATEGIKRWGDDDWTGHAHLLRLLRAAGLRLRIEHLSRESFPERWERAKAAGCLPGLVTANSSTGVIGTLLKQGRLLQLVSERLTWTPENASCSDFAGRWLYLVADARNGDAARRAAAELLRPGPEVSLPGLEVPTAAGRVEAIDVSRRAAVAYLAGDVAALREVLSDTSPQLSRCTEPEEYLQGRVVAAEVVQVRGNEMLAFAMIEAEFRGKTMLGSDPVLVVLRRENARWKAFAVSNDIVSMRELPALCRLGLRPGARAAAPPTPRLVYPADGAPLGESGRSFAWEVGDGGDSLAAQVCQVLLDSGRGGWPMTRLKVYPGSIRRPSLALSETQKDLTGVTAGRMHWCVWAVGRDGGLSVSETWSYGPPR